METVNVLSVLLGRKKVGTLAVYQKHITAFEYSDEWLETGFSISPFVLPLVKKVFLPKLQPFDGLFGIFSDSLPDGWGRLLVDRMLRKNGIDPATVNMLNRLAIVGSSGMGALTYYPEHITEHVSVLKDYDALAKACADILRNESTDDLDTLFLLGGSSGGARPKIFATVDDEDWIVKFPASADRRDIGAVEYLYSECAKRCGIEMSETRLFPSKTCEGYFGTKRFDRIKSPDGSVHRIHVASVSALLETSHRVPNLDYSTLLALTLKLTGSYTETEKMFRLMCFNVYAHNRDDHSKNFSFLFDETSGKWRLSPAYDLTYSNSLGGEHATCVNGNGLDPGLKEMLFLAETIGIKKSKAKQIAEQVEDTVHEALGDISQYR